ncbi:TrmB family transcriptional regulator [Methanolobus halotolerans]|nr:helix-turn-helix domain-containing protein [Methanolobus halotolerans]
MLLESLQNIGLTSYEARVFVALVKNEAATVSTLSSDSGVPSSAIYGALRKLEKKGIIEVQKTRPACYKCIPPEAAVNKLQRSFAEECDNILLELDRIYRISAQEEVEEAIWTISGVRNVMDKIIQLMGNAQEEILVLSSSMPFSMLAEKYSPLKKDYEAIIHLFNKKTCEGIKVRFVSSTENEACNLSKNIPLASIRVKTRLDLSCKLKSFVIMVDNSEILVYVITQEKENMDLKAIWTNGKEFSSTLSHLLNAEWELSKAYEHR